MSCDNVTLLFTIFHAAPRFLYVYVLMERAALYRAIHYAHLRVRCVYITIAGRSHAGQLQGNYRWKEEMKGFFLVQSMQK